MEYFSIQPNDCLSKTIQACYHSIYIGGLERHKMQGTIENYICVLKNDFGNRCDNELNNAQRVLYSMIFEDLQTIKSDSEANLTVCVVPRAKVFENKKQLLFKETVKQVVENLGMNDGTDYLKRISDTQTTHNALVVAGGNGITPYTGITKDTCNISDEVAGKDILLIDDVYTPGANIDEDAIQALLDKGANSVIFYAVGRSLRDS